MPLVEEGGSPRPSCWFCGVVEATSCSSAIACASWNTFVTRPDGSQMMVLEHQLD
jgi:hypothetical protein